MSLRRMALAAAALVLPTALLAGCEPDRVELRATPSTPAVGQTVTLELVKRSAKTGDLVIAEGPTTLKRCNGADRCAVTVASSTPIDRRFTGALVTSGSNLDSVIYSAIVVVQWVDARVSLRASATSAPLGTVVTLTAVASTATVAPDVTIAIKEDETVVSTCTGRATCAHRARVDTLDDPNGLVVQRIFTATLSRPGSPTVTSDWVIVTWTRSLTSTTTSSPSTTTSAPPVIGTPEPPPAHP